MADFLRDADVERALTEHIIAAVAPVSVHVPGTPWAVKDDVWAEPRIGRVQRNTGERQRRGASSYPLTIEIRCVVVNAQKGEPSALSKLVDKVRPAIDYTARRGALKVTDAGGVPVALVQFGEADETRAHGVAVSRGGDSSPDCDTCILTVVCQVATL